MDDLGKEFKIIKSCKAQFCKYFVIANLLPFFITLFQTWVLVICFYLLKVALFPKYLVFLKRRNKNVFFVTMGLQSPPMNFHHRLRQSWPVTSPRIKPWIMLKWFFRKNEKPTLTKWLNFNYFLMRPIQSASFNSWLGLSLMIHDLMMRLCWKIIINM